MQFHHYASARPSTYSGSAESFIDDGLYGRIGVSVMYDNCDASLSPLLLEKAWRLVGRPYYNVFPVVTGLCSKTKLDVPWEQVSFPFSPLLFRFPVSHEPHGIAAALVYTVPPGDVSGFDYGELPAFDNCWSAATGNSQFKSTRPCAKVATHGMCDAARKSCSYVLNRTIVCFVQFSVKGGMQSLLWSMRADSWKETVEQTFASPATPDVEILDGIDCDQAALFLCRLSVLAALVGQGKDLITPEILSKDQHRYQSAGESEKQWIEDRAARVNGRGFSFGKELQKQSLSPHWRNPHMALFWTGEKRSVPVLKLRSGCVVSSTHLSEIPTGFLSNSDDADASMPSFVYRTPVSKRLRFFVLRRDGYRCQLCGLTQHDGVKLEVDHKIPVARGGQTTPENLWTLCHPCNNGKSDSNLYATAKECRNESMRSS